MSENEPSAGSTPQEQTAAPEAAASPAPTGEAKQAEIPFEIKETTEIEGSVVRYRVEIPRCQLDGKVEETFKDLRKTAMIEGFRPGHAPLQLLKIRFGEQTRKDAIEKLMRQVGDLIIARNSLQAISEPTLHDSKAEEGQPVELQIDIEVRPRIDVQGYKGLTVEVEKAEVSEKTVEDQLEMIRQANATYEVPKESKAYAEGDGVTLDVTVYGSDNRRVEDLCMENAFLRDPRHELPAEVVAELVGKKAGETFTCAVKRPGRSEKQPSQEQVYRVKIRDVKERVVPVLDDEFAKDVGDFATLEDLRRRIRDDLRAQIEQRKRTQAIGRLFDKIIEANPFQAPRTIVAAQQYRTIVSDTQQLARMGLDFSAMGMSTEGYLAHARNNSERFVKINLLINAIAEKESLQVSDEDMEKEFARLAEIEGRKPLAIRAKYEAEKRLDSLRRELMVNKVEDLLMQANTIREVEPKPAAPPAQD